MPSSLNSALAKIETLVAQGGDADAVLRDVVAALHADAGYAWAGIFFVEDGALVLGPHAGTPNEAARLTVPVTWSGDRIAALAIDGAPEEDRMFLERVASLVADHCLVGWDTGGESWEP
jgi:putative methionine-R-sulfoxide reductase with GAF domain